MTQRTSNQENSLPTSNDQTLSERLRDCVKVTFSAGLHGVESDCRQAAEELDRQRAEIERLTKALRIAELKASGTLANNLCPDHRDKQSGKPCLACEIERLQKRLPDETTAQPTACEAWETVTALIKLGPLPGNGCDETAERNGLVLAANAIRALMDERARAP